jgi:hypothetical protein
LLDDILVNERRGDLGFLAFDDKRFLLGAFLGEACDGTAKETIEALEGCAVLKAGLLGVLALAELDPVFEERGGFLVCFCWGLARALLRLSNENLFSALRALTASTTLLNS